MSATEVTTKDLAWVSRLASVSALGELRRTLASYHPALAVLPKRIAILGAADEGRRLADLCDREGIDVTMIVDDDPVRQSSMIGAHRVEPGIALDGLDRDIPVVVASHRTLDASRALKARGFDNVSPFVVLQALHPDVFPPHMFHAGWFEDLWENRQRYVDLALRLADDPSRAALDAVLGYRQTLVPEVLSDVVRPHDPYVPRDLFVLAEDEVYVDGGSFDGDTIRLFVERAGGRYSKVFGFEPDPGTFGRLVGNFANEPRVVPVNAGLWIKVDTLRFHNDAGRASIIDNSGDIEVKVVALDDVLKGERVSIIKMNIEGAELEALRGAAATMRRHTPKLALAAYHRPSDLWAIPALVDELAPGYSWYLRQHGGGVIETVWYAARP